MWKRTELCGSLGECPLKIPIAPFYARSRPVYLQNEVKRMGELWSYTCRDNRELVVQQRSHNINSEDGESNPWGPPCDTQGMDTIETKLANNHKGPFVFDGGRSAVRPSGTLQK